MLQRKKKVLVPMKDDITEAFYDYTSLITSKVASVVFLLIAAVFVTRLLGAEELGKLSLFMLVAKLFLLFFVSWTSGAVLRLGKEEFLKKKKLNAIFWNRNIYAAIGLALSFLLIIFFKDKIRNYIGCKTDTVIAVLFFYIIVFFSYDYMTYIFQATSNLKTFAWTRFLYNFSFFAVILVIALCFDNVSIIHVIIAGILAQAVGVISGLKRMEWKWFFPVSFSKKTCQEIFIFSPLFFGLIMSFVVKYVDIIVINKYMMMSDVGVYSLAYKVMEFIKQFVMEVVPILMPIIIGLYIANKDSAIRHYVKRILSQCVFGWCLVLTAASFGCVLIPVLFGQEFSGAVFPLQILIVGLGFSGLASLTNGIIVTYKRIKPMVFINVVLGVSNLIGDLLLVPLIGIKGAAASTAFAFFLCGIGYLFLVMRITKEKNISSFFLPIPLIVPVICHVFNIHMMLGAFFVVLIYVIFLRYFRIFQAGDEKILDKSKMPLAVKKMFTRLFLLFSVR